MTQNKVGERADLQKQFAEQPGMNLNADLFALHLRHTAVRRGQHPTIDEWPIARKEGQRGHCWQCQIHRRLNYWTGSYSLAILP